MSEPRPFTADFESAKVRSESACCMSSEHLCMMMTAACSVPQMLMENSLLIGHCPYTGGINNQERNGSQVP